MWGEKGELYLLYLLSKVVGGSHEGWIVLGVFYSRDVGGGGELYQAAPPAAARSLSSRYPSSNLLPRCPMLPLLQSSSQHPDVQCPNVLMSAIQLGVDPSPLFIQAVYPSFKNQKVSV